MAEFLEDLFEEQAQDQNSSGVVREQNTSFVNFPLISLILLVGCAMIEVLEVDGVADDGGYLY